MFTSKYTSIIDACVWASFAGVRDARIKRDSACDAMARAVEKPMDSGLTPVMRTGGVSYFPFLEEQTRLGTCLPSDVLRECFCDFKAVCLLVSGRVRCHRCQARWRKVATKQSAVESTVAKVPDTAAFSSILRFLACSVHLHDPEYILGFNKSTHRPDVNVPQRPANSHTCNGVWGACRMWGQHACVGL